MTKRRDFIRGVVSFGATAWAGALVPRVAGAQTVGGGLTSWAGATPPGTLAAPGILLQAWAGKFTSVVPWVLAPGAVMKADAGKQDIYTVTATQTIAQVLPTGLPATTVWGYANGTLPATSPGRTIVARRDAAVTVRWYNGLGTAVSPLPHLLGVDQTIAMQKDATGKLISGVPIAVHHHGNDSAPEFDGGPDQWFTPQRNQIGPGITSANQTTAAAATAPKGLNYTYTNRNAEASMHWYHDHADGMTRINAYAGLAGLYIVRDGNEDALVKANWLPTGEYEVPLVIADRVFDDKGQLAYVGDIPAFNGWNTVSPLATKQLLNPDRTTAFYPIPAAKTLDPSTGQVVAAAPIIDPVTGNPVVDSTTGYYKADTTASAYDPNDAFALVAGKSPTHVPEFYGDVICVNGKAWPTLPVEPRQYRLRLLNGSDSRFYNFRFENPITGALIPFSLIATDQGFLNAPVPVPESQQLMGPGERMDVLIDFTGMFGTKIQVLNDATFPYPSGQAIMPGDMWGTVMQIDVSKALNTAKPLTALPATKTLRGNTPDSALLPKLTAAPATAKVTRKILLGEGCDEYGRIMPLLGTVYGSLGTVADADAGTKAFHDAPDISPKLGATEVWEFWNTTVDAHPIHMHLVKFRVLNRQVFSATPVAKPMAQGWTGVRLLAPPVLSPLAADLVPAPDTEQGWKDTVVCPPGSVTRVVATFEKRGTYVYHCHILGHEEHDMMRWFKVI
jgi:spore coat protein A